MESSVAGQEGRRRQRARQKRTRVPADNNDVAIYRAISTLVIQSLCSFVLPRKIANSVS